MLAALLLFLAAFTLASAAPADLSKRYTGVLIQSHRSGLCLSRYGPPRFTNGVPIQTTDCQSADRWNINPGSGSVFLTGTNWALDAGTGRDNNEPVRIWTSYPGLFQQTWYYTNDHRLAITGGNQCLDESLPEGYRGLQTYQCTTGNTNQIFYILQNPPAITTPVKVVTKTATKSKAAEPTI
ncbi:hypothetical protein IAT38_002177 [Cryptococcus sp. DSM 104549]